MASTLPATSRHAVGEISYCQLLRFHERQFGDIAKSLRGMTFEDAWAERHKEDLIGLCAEMEGAIATLWSRTEDCCFGGCKTKAK